MTVTFGGALAAERKKVGLSQKDLASRILKDDGTAISPQYLNDIERDRRNPPSQDLIAQFSNTLGTDVDWLYYLAGQFAPDLRTPTPDQEVVSNALVAFRRAVRPTEN